MAYEYEDDFDDYEDDFESEEEEEEENENNNDNNENSEEEESHSNEASEEQSSSIQEGIIPQQSFIQLTQTVSWILPLTLLKFFLLIYQKSINYSLATYYFSFFHYV